MSKPRASPGILAEGSFGAILAIRLTDGGLDAVPEKRDSSAI